MVNEENIVHRVLSLVEYCKDNNIRGIKFANDIIEKANLGNSYISDLKSGRVKHPSAEAIGAISNVTGASISWLVYGEGDPFAEGDNDDFKEKIERSLNRIKEEKRLTGSSQKLLSVFRDQLNSQINQHQSLIFQLESMRNLVNLYLEVDEKG